MRVPYSGFCWSHPVLLTGGEGQQEQFAPGLQGKGASKQCCTCSNKIRSSVIFQSSFFKGLVSLYFWLKSACSFALHFMLLMQIMHSCLTWLLRSPLARSPYIRRTCRFKTANRIRQPAGIYVLCARTKSLRSPQNALHSV